MYNSIILLSLKRMAFFLSLILVVHLTMINDLVHAQSSDQRLHMTYSNHLLTISAKDADLKNVLLKLADKTNIYVQFPISLKKKITIIKSKAPLKDALQRLLKGLNHAIIYSGSEKGQTSISKVFVFKRSKKSRQVGGSQTRIANKIRVYERQIEHLKNNLSKIDENSRRGRNYLRRIMVLKKRIEKLERRYN